LTISSQLQKERYPKTFETLQLGRPIHQKEKIASLGQVWDERDKLIRISGRVILALRDKNIEPPIVLPANHKIVILIITDKHESIVHAGVKTTLYELKERFWVVKGRLQTKKVWFACVKCQKLSSLSCCVCLYLFALLHEQCIWGSFLIYTLAPLYLHSESFAAGRGPVSVMYSDNAQTFRCVDRHLNILKADPTVQDLLVRKKKLLWIFSVSLAPW
jgi:hypothetical protein